MTDCIICGHSLREHYQIGCQHHGVLGNGCGCSYVQQPPLPPRALVAEHRTRSDWWDRQARISWDLATESKDDLDRWYRLMRFHRAARRAELTIDCTRTHWSGRRRTRLKSRCRRPCPST